MCTPKKTHPTPGINTMIIDLTYTNTAPLRSSLHPTLHTTLVPFPNPIPCSHASTV